MLGVLCARPKPWILTALSFTHCAAYHRLESSSPISFVNIAEDRRRLHHSSSCRLGSVGGGTASIWHAILPSGGSDHRNSILKSSFRYKQKGEGSWNVGWDVRPARWLHGSDSAWLLFGVCSCFVPLDVYGGNLEVVDSKDEGLVEGGTDVVRSDENDKWSLDYRVTGVPADGRCLFRAVAHGACLRKGEEAPDETRQRELADDLRAQVVDELSKRRKETECFIDGDFDAYVKNIQEPYVWGGEPELLMASHVLQTPISVFMMDRKSGKLTHITTYCEEYGKDKEDSINVLFHGYGHYDVLESISVRGHQKIDI